MNLIAWATGLAPYAGIAFLWFLGVIRDRLGKLEDQFFSTVFFGSGLLFVAMMFTSSALTSSTNSTIQFIHPRLKVLRPVKCCCLPARPCTKR